MPAGRPTDYCQEIADAICERLAEGESLRNICDGDDMPNRVTVYRWLFKFQEFSNQYARAREYQAETMADEMKDISDDGTNDWMEKHGDQGEVIGWRENGEAIRRSALRIDTRKWIAARLLPKKYGDKLGIDQKTTVEASDPLLSLLADIASSGKKITDR